MPFKKRTQLLCADSLHFVSPTHQRQRSFTNRDHQSGTVPPFMTANTNREDQPSSCKPTQLTQRVPACAYVVSKKDPSPHLSRAFLAAGFPENSTMPFPEGRPLSSTMTTALSTWPNMEKASSRSSLDTNCGRFLTVSDALWQAKRTRSCFPRRGMLSSSTFAISARVRVSCGQNRHVGRLSERCFWEELHCGSPESICIVAQRTVVRWIKVRYTLNMKDSTL